MAEESALYCDHCGLPLSLRQRTQAGIAKFCCLGCRMAQSLAGEGKGPLDFLEARLLFSAFLAMGVMTFSLVLYGESIYAAESDSAMKAVRTIGRLALAFFSLPVFLLLGLPLLRGAWLDLKAGTLRMDGLITLATLAAYGLSIHNSLQDRGEVYYETATMVLVLVTFGRRLEAASRMKGRDAADQLSSLLPAYAHRRTEDGTEDVDPSLLAAGDRVSLLPGEAAPADLVVTVGESEYSAAHITGEHQPRSIQPGTEIPAGAVNGTGRVEAQVLRPAEQGSLGRIRRLLDSPLGSSRFIRLADRLAGWLAFLAITVAVLAGSRAAAIGGLGAGIERALSVLLVACPCALGLATPLAFRAMRAALAHRAILVSDSRALETAADVDMVFLDKTGTLTESMGSLRSLPGSSGFERLQALVASSNHPLAHALPVATLVPSDLRVVPGSGVEGRFDGLRCRAGSPTWMDRDGCGWGPGLEAQRDLFRGRGATLVAYAEEGQVMGIAALEQSLKPSAVAAITQLKSLGLEVEILSGDSEEAVAFVASALGIKAHAGMKPEDKSRRLAEASANGRKIMMIGDGMNDAPVLRAADVAVVVRDATAAARSQAGIEIMSDDLSALPFLVDASRRLRVVAQGNLIWTCIYNSGALLAAATGHLHPLMAAALMILSSLIVGARSYRLMEFRTSYVPD